jgi:hypothetical protein
MKSFSAAKVLYLGFRIKGKWNAGLKLRALPGLKGSAAAPGFKGSAAASGLSSRDRPGT